MEMHKVSPLRPTPVISPLANDVSDLLRAEYTRGMICGENIGISKSMRSIRKVEDKALGVGFVLGGALGAIVTAVAILGMAP